jgi:hypothetical protein
VACSCTFGACERESSVWSLLSSSVQLCTGRELRASSWREQRVVPCIKGHLAMMQQSRALCQGWRHPHHQRPSISRL